MVPVTKAQRAKQMPDVQTRRPRTHSATSVMTAEVTGQVNCFTRFEAVDLRHASSGPMPVSSRRTSPIGLIHLVKKGSPTVRRSPVTASLNVGNIVANRMKKAENSRIQL